MAAVASVNELLPLNTHHKDLIHDISFNHDGKMLATCSSDQTIKIWNNTGSSKVPSWTLLEEITRKDGHTHKASITMVQWASPVFGCIFASCSTDNFLNIFARRDFKSRASNTCTPRKKKRRGFHFDRIYYQNLTKDAVAIAFAPPHLGLQLAVACKEGTVTFLKAKVNKFESDLRQWNQSVIDLTKTLPPCLSFPSLSPALLSSVSASASNPNSNPIHRPSSSSSSPLYRNQNGLKPFCMAWNASKWELPAFVVGADRNRVFVFKYFDRIDSEQNGKGMNLKNTASMERAQTVNAVDDRKKDIDWHCVSVMNISTKKGAASFEVRGISWSAHLARKYHLIAIGCSDGFVRILQVMRHRRVLRKDRIPEDPFKLEWSVVFESNIHCDAVWKVNWNITGNLLLSAGDDARIYLWKRSRMGGNEEYVPTCISNGRSNDKHKDSIDNEIDDEDEEECNGNGNRLVVDSNLDQSPMKPSITRVMT